MGCRYLLRLRLPKRVEFQRPPAHPEMHEKHFGCRVVFKVDQNAQVFSKSNMELPATPNADLLGIVAPQLEAGQTEQFTRKAFSAIRGRPMSRCAIGTIHAKHTSTSSDGKPQAMPEEQQLASSGFTKLVPAFIVRAAIPLRVGSRRTHRNRKRDQHVRRACHVPYRRPEFSP
jgi:hypothetical protein